jgi:hypothetical protein
LAVITLLTRFLLTAVRVRPPLKQEDPGYDLIPQRFRRSTCQVNTPTSLTVESAQGKKLFVFDRVFQEDVDQEGVWEYLSESVNSFVQGYNVSILAYGQSGAGKSYTMGTSGPEEQSDARLMGKQFPNLHLSSLGSPLPTASVPKTSRCPSIALTCDAGVVPRAAGELFDKLHPSSGKSGIKSPARYSMHGMTALQNYGKGAEKNWKMTATYVEV